MTSDSTDPQGTQTNNSSPTSTEELPGTGTPVHSRTRVVEVSPEHLNRNRILAIDEENPLSDQFNLLRTRIYQKTRPAGWNTIQITGFSAGEGKSLVAANLAISMAKDTRQTTLLVDLDFRKPAVRRLFGLGRDFPGLESYFLDRMPLEEILINPGIEKLTLLPAKGGILNPTEWMGSPRMEALIRELKDRYQDRYILFDTPSINVCPDPLVICDYVDALLLVARADHTTTDDVKAALDLIPKAKVLGLVLNDARGDEPSGYYYRYRYGEKS